MKNNLRIAVIEGDGIGKEVVPEGLRVLEAAASKFNIDIRFDTFDFASCDYYAKYGMMMPEDWKAQIGGHDAIFFGAVGWPDTVPDHISLWGSLIKFRREFDQYVNLRPVRLMSGVPSPLAGRTPGDIDFLVVRSADGLCSSAVSDPQISANHRPKRIRAAAVGRPFHPRIRHKLDQSRLQDLGADSLRSSNPHRSCERRQRPFLNAVSSLGGFRTPASPCLAPPRARGRRPKPFTKAAECVGYRA